MRKKTKKRRKIVRLSAEEQLLWNNARAIACERDDNRCVRCGQRKDSRHRIDAHHIKLKSVFPVLRYDPNNLVMLCKRCHIKFVHSVSNLHGKRFYLDNYDPSKGPENEGNDALLVLRTANLSSKTIKKK